MATKITAMVFCAISPNFSLGYTLLTLDHFVSPFPVRDGTFFQMGVLGAPALALACHAIFWYSLFLVSLVRSILTAIKVAAVDVT